MSEPTAISATDGHHVAFLMNSRVYIPFESNSRVGLRGESEMQLRIPNPVTFVHLPSMHGIMGEFPEETSQEHVAGWQKQEEGKVVY